MTKFESLFLMPCVLLLALFSGIQAQEGDGPGSDLPRQGLHPPPPVIAALDTDRDGELSSDEIANAAQALTRLDRNGDGKLTQDELRPPDSPGECPREGGPRGQ